MHLYYNPRCSKSRAARSLLEEAGHAVEIVDYLDEPPDAATLAGLIDRLDVAAAELVREHDRDTPSDRDAVIALLQIAPERMQRPLLDTGRQAIIARPPERVFELVDPILDPHA